MTRALKRFELYELPIDANIAGGKSTTLEAIAKRPNLLKTLLDSTGNVVYQTLNFQRCHVVVVPEPLDNWTCCGGIDLLGEFYRDQERFAFVFQLHALQTRLANELEAIISGIQWDKIRDAPTDTVQVVVLTERSYMTDCEVFASLQHDLKNMSEAEWVIYQNCYSSFLRAFNESLQDEARRRRCDIVIRNVGEVLPPLYMHVPAEEAWERVKLRARPSEVGDPKSALTLEYLQKLEAKHLQHNTDRTVVWITPQQVSKALGLSFHAAEGDAAAATAAVDGNGCAKE